MKRKLITAGVAALFGFSILQAAPASATVSWGTGLADCDAPNGTTGFTRMYVNYQRDNTPNPDKIRPVFFEIQNALGNTASIQDMYWYQAGDTNPRWWMTGADVVLPTVNTFNTHTMGNWWKQNDAGHPQSLPWKSNPSVNEGTWHSIWRPGKGPSYLPDYAFTPQLTQASSYGPQNMPWWTSMTPGHGPYFTYRVYSQGSSVLCRFWLDG